MGEKTGDVEGTIHYWRTDLGKERGMDLQMPLSRGASFLSVIDKA